MADIALLTQLIEPEAKALGFELVRVKMYGGTSDPTLQVMAERPDTRQLNIDDRIVIKLKHAPEWLDDEELNRLARKNGPPRCFTWTRPAVREAA